MNTLNNQIKIGNKVRILIEKSTFTKGYEPSYSKTIYTVVNGNGYSYSLVDNSGQELKKTWKYYQLKEIEASDTFKNEHEVERERPMSNSERHNKRELDELKRIPEPKNKRRKIFQGTYFLKK
jgi:ribosomal protein L21E